MHARFELGEIPIYNIDGRFYLVPYDTTDPSNPYVRAGVATAGVMALFQKCSHLGCRVPFCTRSQWFECPCHGSKYNKWGEWVGGPAPRGLDRFPSRIDDEGNLLVDTGALLTGPARTARVLQQQAEGPACIDA